MGRIVAFSQDFLSKLDLVEDLVCFGPTYKMNMYHLFLFLLFMVNFGLCWRT